MREHETLSKCCSKKPSINEGTKYTTDVDLSSVPVGTMVKINAGAVYDTYQRTLKVDASANTFTVLQTVLEEPKFDYIVNANVSSNTTITIRDTAEIIAPGMQVEGTGIPTNTKIAKNTVKISRTPPRSPIRSRIL